jgi:tetratricopeptide (TPR) repeat protein
LKFGSLLVVVLAAVCIAYSNHFQNGFHFDDSHTITDNPYIRDLSNIPRFFTDATTFSIYPRHHIYRPIVSASLALDYRLGGGYDVFWFHLSTFLVYLVQLIAMYVLFAAILDAVRRDSRNRYIALFGTALYGLHPAMAETVNYIIQRGDVYVACGIVSGLALYACLPRWRVWGIYLIPFAFAALSKQPGVIFPLLLLLYVLYFENEARQSLYRLGIAILPAAVLSALLGWLQLTMTPKTFLSVHVPAWSYLITQPFVLLRYFSEFFLPIHLSADTDLKPFTSLNGEALLGFLFVFAVAVTIWRTARRTMLRPISLGLAWFLIASLPTSLYPLPEIENDHRMFLPFVGLALAASWSLGLGAEAYLRRYDGNAARGTILAACLAVLGAGAYGTHARNDVWRTDESLWYDVTQKSPRNAGGLMAYGRAEMQRGNYAVALEYLQRARALSPTNPRIEGNLGSLYDAQGRPDEAETHFQRSVLFAPFDAEIRVAYASWLNESGRLPEALDELQIASQLSPTWIGVRNQQMHAYVNAGDIGDARRVAAEALRVEPRDTEARRFLASPDPNADYWVTLSFQSCGQRRYLLCIFFAREALKRKPYLPEAYHNIGAAYALLGIWDKAIENERLSLAIDPRAGAGRNFLSLYEEQRRKTPPPTTPEGFLEASVRYRAAGLYTESIAAARRALRRRPNYAEAYDNISADYEALGKWDDAIGAARDALRIEPSDEAAKSDLGWALLRKREIRALP